MIYHENSERLRLKTLFERMFLIITMFIKTFYVLKENIFLEKLKLANKMSKQFFKKNFKFFSKKIKLSRFQNS